MIKGTVMCFMSFSREREQKPHFSQPGTFEFEYVSRWKALHEMDKQQRQLVDKNIREAKEKLEAELESAKNEHQLMLMTQGESLTLQHFYQPREHNPVIIDTFK